MQHVGGGFSIDHEHFGGTREAPHTTCDRSTHRGMHRDGCYQWHHQHEQQQQKQQHQEQVGRPKLARSYKYLRLTQDGGMESTMKNLAFVARYVRCTITRKACVSGVHIFGFGVHLSHILMHCWGPRCASRLGTMVIQSSLCHFMQQPQSILCGTCNMPLTMRRNKAQCNVKRHARQLTPSVCRMKLECKGAIANTRAPKASKKSAHFVRCCGCIPSPSAMKSTTANSSWFAPTICGRSHRGSNLRQRYSRVGAINNKRSTQWNLPKLFPYTTIKGGAKDISMDTASRVRSVHDSTNCCLRWGQAHEALHNK